MSALLRTGTDVLLATPVLPVSGKLEIRNIVVRFGGIHALQDVSLEVRPGEILGLVGPNGSGKSTMFNAISGAVAIAGGEMRLDGADLTGMGAASRTRHGIARTFQTPRIDPALTVEDAVRCGFYTSDRTSLLSCIIGREMFSGRDRKQHAQCTDLLRRLGLDGIADTPLGELALGQVRLVDVARAVAAGSRYLLLDEPAAGLTLKEQARLAETIKDLAAHGVGIVLVEHNFAMLSSLCEEIVVLSRGKVLLRGATSSIRRDPKFIDAYLGSSGSSHTRPPTADGPVAENAKPIFTCAQVNARYGPIEVIHNASLSVFNGETLLVLGLNGAGKTSLLNALCGLVSHDGAIAVGETSLTDLAPHRRVGAGLAFVPETRGNIFAQLSVNENLMISLELHPRSERHSVLLYLFDLFPILADRLQTAAGMLSGGEQQMLAIAMAVARKPKVLLLDEPSQGLAPTIYDTLEAVFRRLTSEGMALIVTEQNLSFASRIASRFMVMVHGVLRAGGSIDELHDPAHIAKHYLEDSASTVH